jgi:hypothetical protein
LAVSQATYVYRIAHRHPYKLRHQILAIPNFIVVQSQNHIALLQTGIVCRPVRLYVRNDNAMIGSKGPPAAPRSALPET